VPTIAQLDRPELNTRTAALQLAEHLPEAASAACTEFGFGPLADNPERVGAPLRKPFEGQWRARRGEYRVRYRIAQSDELVCVLDVDHRRTIGIVVGNFSSQAAQAARRRYHPAGDTRTLRLSRRPNR